MLVGFKVSLSILINTFHHLNNLIVQFSLLKNIILILVLYLNNASKTVMKGENYLHSFDGLIYTY